MTTLKANSDLFNSMQYWVQTALLWPWEAEPKMEGCFLFTWNLFPLSGGKWKVVSKVNKIQKEVISVNSTVKTLLGVLGCVGYICCLVVLKSPNKTKPKSYRHGWSSAMLLKSIGAHATAQCTRDHTNTDQNLLCALRSSFFTPRYYTMAIILESAGLHY